MNLAILYNLIRLASYKKLYYKEEPYGFRGYRDLKVHIETDNLLLLYFSVCIIKDYSSIASVERITKESKTE